MDTNILLFSSLIFITNIFTTFYKKYYEYCLLFIVLTVTSLIFHYNSNIYTNVLDKIFILAIVIYGSYMLYSKSSNEKVFSISIIVITFILCIFLFFYGYCTNNYCYDSDKCVGDRYHCLLHCISSLGHHIITFL